MCVCVVCLNRFFFVCCIRPELNQAYFVQVLSTEDGHSHLVEMAGDLCRAVLKRRMGRRHGQSDVSVVEQQCTGPGWDQVYSTLGRLYRPTLAIGDWWQILELNSDVLLVRPSSDTFFRWMLNRRFSVLQLLSKICMHLSWFDSFLSCLECSLVWASHPR